MNTVHTVSSPRRLYRLATPLAALVVAVAVGGIAGRGLSESEVAASTTPPAAPSLDLDRVAQTAVSVVNGISAALPVPGPSPLDARAPTPKVQWGTLEIPSIGLSQPFFEGVTLTAIDNGPSHWPGTAMPGELGNAGAGWPPHHPNPALL